MMKIDENYRIVTDNYGCMLKENRLVKSKKYQEGVRKDVIIGYYPNVRMCLQKYVDEKLKPSKDILDCIEQIKKLTDKIDLLCKK